METKRDRGNKRNRLNKLGQWGNKIILGQLGQTKSLIFKTNSKKSRGSITGSLSNSVVNLNPAHKLKFVLSPSVNLKKT